MLPGPIIIRQCIECSGLIQQDTFASGNTFGATFWTDGKVEAPMAPDSPRLVKCPHCRALLWIDEQEQVAEIDYWSDYKGAKPYYYPELQDYFNALKKGGWSKKKQRYLHLHAWWEGNDQRRDTPPKKQHLSPDERKNLKAFYRMLNPTKSEDRVLMAEIKRELGEFEAAVALLDKPVHKSQAPLANYIKELAQKHVSRVAVMENRV